MGVVLEKVVPWGRSLDEYRLMFALSHVELQSKILGCGDGPASFNAEMHQLGNKVVSVDPIYSLTKQQIEKRVVETYDTIVAQCKTNYHNFLWTYFTDPDHLGQRRLAAMKIFLQDFDAGLDEGRYIAESLPLLSFADGEFDLALCSHLLFLYSEHLSLEFHIDAIRQMCRVAREVRIFPLLDLNCETSCHIAPIIFQLSKEGYLVTIENVEYEFQRGGNQMMRVRSGPRC